ncbi:DNA-binding transcriptional regulator, XRE-family HTH domain [Butyrivibrio fibrisolvens]|uniref:DNA-binding transcriptional regulator, XRE-family HTH domain n=1 Tax=Butyrivibrio fibrisolvens TaxID=831 RepID=A0A1H9RDA3_BUTFI|nr:helix-turn-helix transcriptional regulator [Butyrivibrio fibrisolvens]SER70710.1 DNA-binding transcriptional regulator, XRE-family HTH domain [Butyrivibrio fibrisolvens]
MEARHEVDLIQKELAERIGVSDRTISKWENGHGMPDVSVIPELCEILSVNSNELLAVEKLESAESFS